MIGGPSPQNPFLLRDPRLFTSHPAGSIFYPIDKSVSGRTQVSPALTPGESTAVIVILGQSNSANHCGGSHVATSPLAQNFYYVNGGVYRASDPLLGCTGDDGCFATFLADSLISGGRYQRVIVAPMGLNGALATDFAENGPFNPYIRVMTRRLAASGLTPTMVLYQQGESDNAEGTSATTITTALRNMVATWRAEGVEAPVFISLTSTWPGYTNNSQVRLGQTNAWSAPLGIYPGPDTDTIGSGGRDGVHFNAIGSPQHAQLWEDVIVSHFGL